MKAISTLQVSPALLKELRLAMVGRKKKPAVPAGRRSTTSGNRTRASHQLAGKRKPNVLTISGDYIEPANSLPAPGAGSAPLPANSSVTGEQAAVGNRQPGPSGGGATYAALLAGPVAPSQPSGTLKPTTMDSDPSESGVSSETTNRHMSSDMSGSLSGTPDGATSNTQVANVCLPAEGRPNKTPIFISGVSDARSFLPWLRATCTGGLMAQLNGEKLVVVPSTADGLRATVSVLRSLGGKGGVSFHTFILPEDRCARLLVNDLSRVMPDSVVKEELESLNIRVQGVTQLRSGRCGPDSAKGRPPIPTSLCQWREGPRCQKCDRSPKFAAC